MAGLNENITNSAKLKLELELSLAISSLLIETSCYENITYVISCLIITCLTDVLHKHFLVY